MVAREDEASSLRLHGSAWGGGEDGFLRTSSGSIRVVFRNRPGPVAYLGREGGEAQPRGAVPTHQAGRSPTPHSGRAEWGALYRTTSSRPR